MCTTTKVEDILKPARMCSNKTHLGVSEVQNCSQQKHDRPRYFLQFVVVLC